MKLKPVPTSSKININRYQSRSIKSIYSFKTITQHQSTPVNINSNVKIKITNNTNQIQFQAISFSK